MNKRNDIAQGSLVVGTGYEFEYLNKVQYEDRSAPNPNYEKTANTTWVFYLNYGLSEKLFIEGLLPWRKVVNNKFTYETRQFIRTTFGFGDAILMGKYRFTIFDEWLQGTIGAGVKLATGMLEEPAPDGARISDNLQIGSGTVDPVFSLYLAHFSLNRKWLFSGNIITRISSGDNIYGYKYGNEMQTSFGINYDYSDKILLQSSFEFIYTMRDTDQYGFRVKRERGGKWLYWTPGMGIRLSDMLLMDIQYPITVYQFVNESQLVSDGFLRINLIYTIKG